MVTTCPSYGAVLSIQSPLDFLDNTSCRFVAWRTGPFKERTPRNPLVLENGVGEDGNCELCIKATLHLTPWLKFILCRGVGAPKVSGNGAAFFEMFSYLICAPVRGPASFSWLGPMSSSPCPTACLVQLITPGAACRSSFTLTSSNFSLLILLLLKPAQFPFPWLLLSFFSCVCESRICLMAPSIGIGMGGESNFFCMWQCHT